MAAGAARQPGGAQPVRACRGCATAIIEGPYNVTGVSETPSRKRLFVCTPTAAAQEAPCAERDPVHRRAARVPAARRRRPTSTRRWRSTARSASAGGDFDAGIRAGLARILTSPAFLFRSEQRSRRRFAAGAAHRVTDLELASRLSFFLWSSIPDDELLNLAIAGRLRAPGVLEAQVRRMIADPRADALMTAFTGQWLQLRNLDKVTPDVLLFPDFDDNVRQAFRRETELLLRQHRAREPQRARLCSMPTTRS